MNLAFVPLYIKYLGIEAYGLIGIFALLQSWLALVDMGMKPSLGREMARFSAGAHSAQSIRDLLRSVEIIGIAIAGTVALGTWIVSGWLAVHWVTVKTLPVNVVSQAFAIMGVVVALRFVEDIYVSSILGLQLQVLQNIVTGAMATARGLGAVAILAWVSPTISAFFIWQGVISLFTVALFIGVIYRALPRAPRPARFSTPALLGIWRFAAGMMAITLLSLLLTQVDKILLARLLTLETFGYYALAGTVASGLYSFTGPVMTAFYPRFTALATLHDEATSREAYHQGAQLVAVLMGSAAVVLMIFGRNVLLLWTADSALALRVAPLMIVLVLGTLLNGLMSIPYQMMLAHGWTRLTITVNIAAVLIIVPALLWIVPRYGAIGAAWAWVVVNAGYVAVTIPLMHRRLLRGQEWRWYSQDVAMPMIAALTAAVVCRMILPASSSRPGELGLLALSAGCVFFAAAITAPAVRLQLLGYLPGRSVAPVRT